MVHEELSRRETPKGSSDREFGVVFTGFAAIAGGYQFWNQSASWPWWLAAAVLLLLITLVRPALVAPLNRLWTGIGHLLFRVVNPVVMAVLFFLVVLPTGLLMRLAGKDPMRRHFDPAAPTYWISRDPPGPDSSTMKNQF